MAEKKRNVRRYYGFAKAFIWVLLKLVSKPLMRKLNAEAEPYTPKHDTFIIIANHSDLMDPGYQMVSLNRYVRFVAADFLLRINFITKFLLGTLEGVIVKRRDKSSEVLVEEILENLRAGIPVGLHAEGKITTNGETGFISEHTGQLVKDSGVALITYRITGGYLRKPRWADTQRTGYAHGMVVNEYSPEELSKYSVKEITDIIRRDVYVNAYDEQRKHPYTYKGEKLAQYAERLLYICPKCGGVGTMRSDDDKFICECGYALTYGEDAFWHSEKDSVIFDNVLDWDKWQRGEWKKKLLSTDGIIYSEKRQIVSKVVNNESRTVFEDAVMNVYKDRFELVSGEDKLTFPFDTLKRVQNAAVQDLVIIDKDSNYYLINCAIPHSSDKYVAAWYYLTGREYE